MIINIVQFGVLFAIAVIFTLKLLDYKVIDFITNRLFAEGSISETTRYKSISTFLDFFPRNPILGDGYRVSEEVRDASQKIGSSHIHVGYLQRLVSYGLIGGHEFLAPCDCSINCWGVKTYRHWSLKSLAAPHVSSLRCLC